MDRSPVSVCVQKFPTDKAYFIAKELLTTERTYLNDLQVITEVRRTSVRLIKQQQKLLK